MVGASVGAFVLLGLSAFTSWPVGGGPFGSRDLVNQAYESGAGDCLNWTKSNLSDVAKVDCANQHLFEVTGVVDIASEYGKDSAFPDDATWQKISTDHCASTSLQYLGNKFDPFGKYSVGPLNPGEKQWRNGYRMLRCGLQVAGPGGGLLPSYGTAKTQDQSDVYDPGVCLGINGKSVGDPTDCGKPHTYEMVGVVDLGAALPGDFPPVEKQDEVLSGQCATISAEYSGGADLKAKGLIVTWDNRVAESWAAGSKKVNCKIGAVPADNTGLTAWNGSVRNPNAPPLKPSNPPQTTAVQQAEPTGAPLHSESGSAAPTSTSGSAPTSTSASSASSTTKTG
jgi:hypothetical protein